MSCNRNEVKLLTKANGYVCLCVCVCVSVVGVNDEFSPSDVLCAKYRKGDRRRKNKKV